MINIVRYPCHTQALVPIVPIWNAEMVKFLYIKHLYNTSSIMSKFQQFIYNEQRRFLNVKTTFT